MWARLVRLVHPHPLIVVYLVIVGVAAAAFFGQSRSDLTICHATKRSWVQRQAVIDALTEPSVLSPEITKLFPANQYLSLKLQIEASNAKKVTQRAALQAVDPKPTAC